MKKGLSVTLHAVLVMPLKRKYSGLLISIEPVVDSKKKTKNEMVTKFSISL